MFFFTRAFKVLQLHIPEIGIAIPMLSLTASNRGGTILKFLAMIHFSTIKHEIIWKFVLARSLLFLLLYLINQVHGHVVAQSGYNPIGTMRSGE